MPSLERARSVLTRRRFLTGGAITFGALGLYAGEIERHLLQTVEHTVLVRNLPASFHGFRIAQLSDFHFRDFDEPFFVQHAVDAINRLAPDMVALTGDFITASHNPSQHSRGASKDAGGCAEILRGIRCPLRFCSLGNHDAVANNEVLAALRQHGLEPLRNAYTDIRKGGDRLWVSGIADAYLDVPDLTKALPKRTPNEPIVLLGHEPDFADTVAQLGSVDLMLAGHTLGGQVRIPLMPVLLLPAMGMRYVEGLHRVGSGLQLYVNRGLGCMHLPFRFNCPPELTVFTLQPA